MQSNKKNKDLNKVKIISNISKRLNVINNDAKRNAIILNDAFTGNLDGWGKGLSLKQFNG